MTFEVIITDKAQKQLKKLERPVQERVIATLERVRIRPEAYLSKLVGDLEFKLRVGDYRVLVDVDWGREIISVVKIGHRRNIYDS